MDLFNHCDVGEYMHPQLAMKSWQTFTARGQIWQSFSVQWTRCYVDRRRNRYELQRFIVPMSNNVRLAPLSFYADVPVNSNTFSPFRHNKEHCFTDFERQAATLVFIQVKPISRMAILFSVVATVTYMRHLQIVKARRHCTIMRWSSPKKLKMN